MYWKRKVYDEINKVEKTLLFFRSATTKDPRIFEFTRDSSRSQMETKHKREASENIRRCRDRLRDREREKDRKL